LFLLPDPHYLTVRTMHDATRQTLALVLSIAPSTT
jgi:hypothetical protein